MSSPERHQPVYLWTDAAPGAKGNGPEDRPKLTPYLLDGPAPRAAVIVCPGGGYQMRAAHEGEPIARWLNAAGLHAFVLDYRLSPYRHPIPLGDAQRAIRLVRANAEFWKVDPQRVGILGFSAGGHLAASAATIFDAGIETDDAVDRQSSRPDALIACYPVISFNVGGHVGSMKNLLGESPQEELRNALSLENRVTALVPPSYIWHTADDASVPVTNSLTFATALFHHKIPFSLHVFPHGRHGLGLAESDPVVGNWTKLCVQWLKDLKFA